MAGVNLAGRMTAFEYEFLYGRAGVHYSGLLASPVPRPAHTNTLTRQRRRADARAQAKRNRT